MFGEAALVRPALCNHDPLADEPRLPPERRRDLGGQSATPIRHRQQVVGIDKLGLELDEEQHVISGMPGDDVERRARQSG